MFIVIENDTEMSETNLFYSEESDGMSKRAQLEEYFSQSLEVDLLLRLCPDDEDTIYQIVDLLVDTCATNRKLLHIAGDDKPAEVVRSRFMKLNADHIKFVLKCLAENSSPIRNMKQYLLASLYNAPTTMQLYLRKMALDGYCLNLDLPQLRRMAYLLQNCSNNLNQVAKRANESGQLYAADLEDLRSRLDELIAIGKQLLAKLSEL